MLEGNHRSTTLLRHMFDFSIEYLGPAKSDVFALNKPFNPNSSKLEDLINFDLNFELYSKPEGVENERYLELCQKKSLKLQTNADLVVHYEKAHELVNLIVCCSYLFTLFSKKNWCSPFLFDVADYRP